MGGIVAILEQHPLHSLPIAMPGLLISVAVLQVDCPTMSFIKHISTSTCIITINSTTVNIAATVTLAISIAWLAHHISHLKGNTTTEGFTTGHYPTPRIGSPAGMLPAYSHLGAKDSFLCTAGFLVVHKVNGTKHK